MIASLFIALLPPLRIAWALLTYWPQVDEGSRKEVERILGMED